MGDPGSGPTVKELPPTVYVCPSDTKDKKPVCASVAIGRILELTIYDSRTHKPVVGATLRRQRIGGADKVMLDYALPTIPDIKKYQSAEDADKCRLAINEYNTLKEEEAKAKADKKALSKAKAGALKTHRKNLGYYERVIEQRERWVLFLQAGLRMLKAYEGGINARLDQDLGKVISEYWQHWTEGKKGDFKPAVHWKVVSELLLQQLKKKYVTDDMGRLFIPLPENFTGKVEIEFVTLKLLDPAIAAKVLGGAPGSSDYKPNKERRIDYDLGSAKGESHANDEAGSTKRESRWQLFGGSNKFPFKNFIEIDIDAPSEKERTKPIAKWTLALLWCQPVWTVAENNHIYDPVDPHHPEDPPPNEDRINNRRGLLGRGLADDARPTLMACTIGTNIRSKHYGVWGDKGRMKDGVPKFHNGIDCAGKVGDPVFAPVGGLISSIFKTGTSGNVIILQPWISGSPRLVQLLHLEDGGIKVKKGQWVKAGDYLANMGRTGNFSPPTPSPYPTHTHFIWDGDLEMHHPPPGLEVYAGILPHNGLPRMLPCGGDYPDYGEGAADNPKNCGFDYDGFVGGKDDWICFAVEELACPFMPANITLADLTESGTRKAKRRFQAQLKWLFDNKDKYSDPGRIDGDLGKPPYARMIGGDKHRTVRRWSNVDPPPPEWPLLFEAEKDEIFPLVDGDKIGDRYKVKLTAEHVAKYAAKAKVNGQEIHAGDIVLVFHNKTHPECKIEHLSSTRIAIKIFNDLHDLDAGYEVSQKGLDTLNSLTGLVKDKNGKSNGSRWQRPTDPLP